MKHFFTFAVCCLIAHTGLFAHNNGGGVSAYPMYVENELIVRFNPANMLLNNANNTNLTWGLVSDFVDSTAITEISSALGFDFGNQACYKVFPKFTSLDTMIVGKFGNPIDLPPLFATFRVKTPELANDSLIVQTLLSMHNHVFYATLNGYAHLTVGANDPHYNNGNSAALNATSLIPDAHINIEPAWDMSTGDMNIRVGIYDSGINYSHLDISQGDWVSSSIEAGFDYTDSSIPPINSLLNPDSHGHGSLIAGIIGAWRNNNFGIAGIAGGNGQGGVSLHDMKIFAGNNTCDQNITTLDVVANAIWEGSTGLFMPFQHIQNHSWLINGPSSITFIIREAFIFAYQTGVVLAGSSGNEAHFFPALPCGSSSAPSNYPDQMMMNIGANDATGAKANFSNCGGTLDLIAPGTHDLYEVMSNNNSDFDQFLGIGTNCEALPNGTSFATPHVVGTAALMLSYINSIDNNDCNLGLSHEDCEALLQMHATDLVSPPNSTGYDEQTGWGRLNAGMTLENIKFPDYVVQHYSFDLAMSNAVLVGANECVYLETPGAFNTPNELAHVNRYEITQTFNHTLPLGYELVSAWSRGSGSRNIVGLRNDTTCGMLNDPDWWNPLSPNFVGNTYFNSLPAETEVELINFDANSATLRGFVYEIIDLNSGNTVSWFPADLNSMATFAYTLYLQNECADLPGERLSGVLDEDLTSNVYRIVDDIEIQGDVSLVGSVFAIDPNVKITVPAGQSLTIMESHLYGCHTLWDGIDVLEEGNLVIRSSSLIEDAKVAVNVQSYSTMTNSNKILISDAIFNKNLTSINIAGYPFENPNQAFIIQNNVITARQIAANPNTWPNINILNAANPASNNDNAHNPRINHLDYPSANYLPLMLNPCQIVQVFNQQRIGISLTDVGLTQGTNFHSFLLGSASTPLPSVFDRMNRGIFCTRSNVMVENSVFQGLELWLGQSTGIQAHGDNGPAMGFMPYEGRILVNSPAPNINQFYNLTRGLDIRGYSHAVVNNARIRTNRAFAHQNIGEVGIRFQSFRAVKFEAQHNQIHNIDNGVFCLIARHHISPSPLDLNISFNTVARSLQNVQGVVPRRGIFVGGMAPNNNFTILSSAPFRIISNTITTVENGIEVQNFVNTPLMYIKNNGITLAPQNFTGQIIFNENIRYDGILLRNISTVKSFVEQNAISGFNATLGNSRGIRVENTTSMIFRCNNTFKTRGGLYFVGNCNGQVRNNSMIDHKYGLWLDMNGDIGQQGSPQGTNSPASISNNTWDGTWSNFSGVPPTTPFTSLRVKTYVSGVSNAIFSRLFVSPSVLTNPTNSWAWENQNFNTPYNGAPLINVIPFIQYSNPCATALLPNEENEISMETEQMLLAGLEQSIEEALANNNLELAILIKEYLTYDQLYRDPDLRDSVQTLEDFYYSKINENMGKLREMEEKIDAHDFDEAESLRDQTIPDNIIEQAYKEVLDLYMKFEKGIFNAADSADLWLWANSCYYVYGKTVPFAQILYNSIYYSCATFEEDCSLNLPKNAAIFPTDDDELALTLYPNPNTDRLFVEYSDESIKSGSIEIIDIDGKAFYSGTIHFERGLDLGALGMGSGVYVVDLIIDKNGTPTSVKRKLVYIKK